MISQGYCTSQSCHFLNTGLFYKNHLTISTGVGFCCLFFKVDPNEMFFHVI